MNDIFSVCVIVINDEGKILGVTRKDDHNDWGLPGGKIDLGETPSSAIYREVFEETGLFLTDLQYQLTKDCIDKDGEMKPCAVYTANATGKINTDEPHLVNWVDKEKLFNGSFGQFNKETFAILNI